MSRTPSGDVLALDVGGTKLAAALVDGTGAVRRRHQVPTSPVGAGSGDALWDTVERLIDDVLGDGTEPIGVGVGCGGPMAWPAGRVSPLNLAAWRDFPLRDRLAARLPDRPLRVHNDAVAMAVGEHRYGAGAGASSMLGVVVSTGVGGGLLLAGRIVDGATGNAGHIGHVVVDPDGPGCGCGGRGCLEAIARGPALVQWALDNGWTPAAGLSPDGRGLAAAAGSGDTVAAAAFARAGHALGVALASAAALLELDRVVVGGGLATTGELLMKPTRAAFERHARLDYARRCRIVPAALGGDAGLVGAAALVTDGDRYWSVSGEGAD